MRVSGANKHGMPPERLSPVCGSGNPNSIKRIKMNAKKMKHVKQTALWLIAFAVMLFTACGGKKQQQAADTDQGEVTFIYQIDNILKMTNGVVLMGQTVAGGTGTLKTGDEIAYYNVAARKMFNCKIESIGLPDGTQSVEEITSDGKAYNLVIYNRTKDDFEISGYLVKGDFGKFIDELNKDL